MVRAVAVRSRFDLQKLANELAKNFTVVFNDDDHLLTMKEGKVVKRFRVSPRKLMVASNTEESVSKLPSQGHILLLTDDADNGLRQEFRFLSDGLSKGERCVYATHDAVAVVEEEMVESGIDVKRFRGKGLLDIIKLNDPFQEKEGYLVGVGKIIDQIMRLKPDRIVSRRWLQDISNSEQNMANREVERNVDAAIQGDLLNPSYTDLQNFRGLLVCTYVVKQIGPRIQWDWLVNHFNHHDTMILTSQSETVALSR